jgi:hypothetical protein
MMASWYAPLCKSGPKVLERLTRLGPSHLNRFPTSDTSSQPPGWNWSSINMTLAALAKGPRQTAGILGVVEHPLVLRLKHLLCRLRGVRQ